MSRRDAIYYATDAQAVDRLRAEYELRMRSGFDAAWLGSGALRRSAGIAGRGAIRTRGSAQFDPYRACLGVLRAAAASGAQLFERSKVRIGPHRRYPRQWFALGYGGNGMTFGLLAARLLLERLQGRVTRDHALFDFARTRRR